MHQDSHLSGRQVNSKVSGKFRMLKFLCGTVRMRETPEVSATGIEYRKLTWMFQMWNFLHTRPFYEMLFMCNI